MADPLNFFSYANSKAGWDRPIVGSGTHGRATPTLGPSPFPGIDAILLPTGTIANSDKVLAPHKVIDGCTFEIWFKLSGWSWSGKTASDGGEHHLIIQLSVANAINIYFTNGAGMYFDAFGSAYKQMALTSESFSDGVWYHIGYVVESARRRAYIDGVLKGIDTSSISFTGAENTHAYGSREGTVAANTGFGGYISRVVFRNYVKTDFSDRFILRAPMNDQRMVV